MGNSEFESGFYPLSDNRDAFVARYALATMASHTLDIQYYIIHNDASGQYLAYAIMSAADRGVKVRILVDDINLNGRDSRLKMMSQHHNIEIRIFNPFSRRDWFRHIELVINLNRAGRRMHNKVFIADDSAAILGGRNIGDEYFDARQVENFVDLDLLITGAVVPEIVHSFEDYWKSKWAIPVEKLSRTHVASSQLKSVKRQLKDRWMHVRNTEYFSTLQNTNLTNKIISRQIPFIYANAHLFYDRPEKIRNGTTGVTVHFGPQVINYMEQAKDSILIASPYFVPGNRTGWFISKQKQGVDITVLTNSLQSTDVTAVHAGYKKYRYRLLHAGLRIFELKTYARKLSTRTKLLIHGASRISLHAKYIVIDRRFVFIGSANIDPRSDALNTEIGVLVESEQLANAIADIFHQTACIENSFSLSIDSERNLSWKTEDDGCEVIYKKEPGAGIWRRFYVYLLGLLPIESLL